MGEGDPLIVLNLDLQEPAELGDFVGAFVALSSQFERYTTTEHADLRADARIYVCELRQGSIEAVLIPLIPVIIDQMDKALIVEQFVKLYGGRLSSYFKKNGRDDDASKGDLKDLMDGVAAIANDPNGIATIKAVTYEKGKEVTKAAVRFDTSQARTARNEITKHRKELDSLGTDEKKRVLMVFKRTDRDDATLGKRSGERVIIEEVSDKHLPLIYGSDLAEQQIKDEIRTSDENVYPRSAS